MDERVVLAMDGATNVSTTALLALGSEQCPRVMARRMDLDSRGQARVLLRLVDDMLRETGRSPADIVAVVAGVGPGTFTGVRIAVATARALALALEIPIVGLSTLSALAAEAAGLGECPAGVAPDVIIPVVDARRGQLFYGLYRRAGVAAGERPGTVVPAPRPAYVRTGPFAVCDRDALFSAIAPNGARTLIVGDVGGLEATTDGDVSLLPLQVRAEHLMIGQSALGEPGERAEGFRLDGWLAEVLARAGGERTSLWKAGVQGSPEAVKPIYVRSPDADIHITKMRDPWADAAAER
jgi:tRNA threonylcarbamoyladenosine biosynthesis protein TsaB